MNRLVIFSIVLVAGLGLLAINTLALGPGEQSAAPEKESSCCTLTERVAAAQNAADECGEKCAVACCSEETHAVADCQSCDKDACGEGECLLVSADTEKDCENSCCKKDCCAEECCKAECCKEKCCAKECCDKEKCDKEECDEDEPVAQLQ